MIIIKTSGKHDILNPLLTNNYKNVYGTDNGRHQAAYPTEKI
jgi:hypothetical protein